MGVPWLVALLLLLAPASASATWPGRDGRIAYDNDDPSYCTGGCAQEGGPSSFLLAVNPISDRMVVLTSASAGNVEDSEPRYSPDGKHLVFFSYRAKQTVVTSSASGRDRRSVPTPKGLSQLVEPTWTRDGKHLLAVGVTHSGRDELLRMAVDGSGVKVLYSARDMGVPAMSVKGQIAFVRGSSIYLLKGHRRLCAGYDPDFSPDGKEIVFYDYRHQAISSIGIDGRGLRTLHRIPHAQDISPHPVYSPNGRFIAFAEGGDIAAMQVPERIEVMDTSGGHVKSLGADDLVRNPDWQPLT